MKSIFFVLIIFSESVLVFGQCPGGSAQGPNLVINGDFSGGNVGFTSTYIYCNMSNCLFPIGSNGYSVGANPAFFHGSFHGSDHTSGSGNLMILNGSDNKRVAWSETLTVIPNTDYVFSAWVSSMYPVNPARINFLVEGQNIGSITAPSIINSWKQFSTVWNSGANTSATLMIKDQDSVWTGSDYGLDDISFTSCSCASASSGIITALRDTVCPGAAPVLSVTGSAGAIQWQYSLTTSNFKDLNGLTGSVCLDIPLQTSYYRVYSSNGNCADTSVAYKIVVTPPPQIDYSSKPSGPLEITFNSSAGSGNIIRYDWNFGDGKSSNLSNPVHIFGYADTFHVCLSVYNGSNCSFTICRDIVVDISTETFNLEEQNDWSIFPNPANESASVTSNSTWLPGIIKIYNCLGQLLFRGALAAELIIPTQNLDAGLYFLIIETANAVETKKIMIVH